MKPKSTTVVLACIAAAASAHADSILILASGDPVLDDLVVAVLHDAGHIPFVGPDYLTFDGSGLAGIDAVYLQPALLWNFGDMPVSGQTALRDFIFAGGGLVTAEWTVWKAAARPDFEILSVTFPAELTTAYGTAATATFRVGTPDPVLSAGLPNEFTFSTTSIGGGTETFLQARTAARVYFESVAQSSGGVVGWGFGDGRVINLSTTVGANDLADPNFERLFINAFQWVTEGACYADCTGEGTLDIFDFLCFQDAFVTGDPYADCDLNTTFDIFDFLCFQDAFVTGCP